MSQRYIANRLESASSISDFPSYIDSGSVESGALQYRDNPQVEMVFEESEERSKPPADLNFLAIGLYSALRSRPNRPEEP